MSSAIQFDNSTIGSSLMLYSYHTASNLVCKHRNTYTYTHTHSHAYTFIGLMRSMMAQSLELVTVGNWMESKHYTNYAILDVDQSRLSSSSFVVWCCWCCMCSCYVLCSNAFYHISLYYTIKLVIPIKCNGFSHWAIAHQRFHIYFFLAIFVCRFDPFNSDKCICHCLSAARER